MKAYRNSEGIIFIDNRDHTHVKEFRKRILGIDILRSLNIIIRSDTSSNQFVYACKRGILVSYICDVASRQKNLRNGEPKMRK